MKELKPVQVLYHGTSLSNSSNIKVEGLQKINHEYVYLTSDIHVAYEYALKNSSEPVICVVDAIEMHKDGYIFNKNDYEFEWLVSSVPPQYILQILIESEDDLKFIVDSLQKVEELF